MKKPFIAFKKEVFQTIVEDDPVFKKPKLAALFKPAAAKAGQVKRKAKVMERDVESDGKKRVTSLGGHSAKFKSPGHRARPDQIELYGTRYMLDLLRGFLRQADDIKVSWVEADFQQFAKDVLAAGIQFTEYKKPGEKPTAAQLREHARLRALGFTVNVVDQRTSKEPK